MENGIDRNAPATKGDLLDLKAGLKAELQSELQHLKAELQSELQHLKEDLQQKMDNLLEAMRDMQTESLKAFYSYAKSTDLKLKEGEMADMILRERVSAMESRITEVERRLNLPPQ